MRNEIRQQWLANPKNDVLAGLVVALALIPEAIAFSIIAGVDPKVGLYASFCIAVTIAFTGGRPAMISAATGSTALVMVLLVKDHGLQYLLAATLLTGVLQIGAGLLKLGALMRFVSRSVITGFVNALAILIFLAQLPELVGAPMAAYAIVAAGLAIIYILPRFTTAVPSPLVCIVVMTAITVGFGIHVHTVGDMGALPDSLPHFLLPDVPLNLDTLRIILPYSVTVAAVGLLESLMTAAIVDEMTETGSNKHRETVGQGCANIVSGLLGGMAGCAMIGQSVINVKSGGRTRLSTLLAGVFLLLMIVFAGPWVARIPMPALVAVMIMVSISTFKWDSFMALRSHPPSSSIVMLATVAVVVATHNLAEGVLVGVLLSALFFARKVGRLLKIGAIDSADGRLRTYRISGQVFFASADSFADSFDFQKPPPQVHIDLTHAHFWDLSAVGALDKVVLRLRRRGVEVEVIGLNEASSTLIERLGIHDKPELGERAIGH